MGLRHTYHPDIDQHSNNNRNNNNNNNSNSNVVIPRYADQRPISPMGFICVHGAKGRLNNLIIQNLVGMHMAFYLNRTLLVDNTVAKYFDIDKLGLESWPLDEYPYKPAIQIHNISCPNSDPDVPLQETLFSRYIRQFTTKRKIFSCLEFTIIRFGWYWLGRPPEDFYTRFFRGLVPIQSIMAKVDDYVSHTFRKRTFSALHLRSLEGHCKRMADDPTLCCPILPQVLDIIKAKGG